MFSKEITVAAPNGLHARPTGDLVKLAKELAPVKITLTTALKSANAASMLSVIGLGLKKGTVVTVSAEDENAVNRIADFILSIKD